MARFSGDTPNSSDRCALITAWHFVMLAAAALSCRHSPHDFARGHYFSASCIDFALYFHGELLSSRCRATIAREFAPRFIAKYATGWPCSSFDAAVVGWSPREALRRRFDFRFDISSPLVVKFSSQDISLVRRARLSASYER